MIRPTQLLRPDALFPAAKLPVSSFAKTISLSQLLSKTTFISIRCPNCRTNSAPKRIQRAGVHLNVQQRVLRLTRRESLHGSRRNRPIYRRPCPLCIPLPKRRHRTPAQWHRRQGRRGHGRLSTCRRVVAGRIHRVSGVRAFSWLWKVNRRAGSQD